MAAVRFEVATVAGLVGETTGAAIEPGPASDGEVASGAALPTADVRSVVIRPTSESSTTVSAITRTAAPVAQGHQRWERPTR